MEKNRTEGSVLNNVLEFSLPYLLSYFLQTLYGMADLSIIGQFAGVESITAVSIGSQVMHMLTVMIVGLAMGATVCIARDVGGGQRETAAEHMGNTITLFVGVSLILTAVLLMRTGPITRLMSTPTEAVARTKVYLTICILGIPFITAYNIISAVFRGLGDSKSPMYFIAVACGANTITIIANRRGLTDAAAVGIVEKIMSFMFLVPSSMLSTVSALGAQNLGAGEPERAKRTLCYAICIATAFGLVTAVAVQLAADGIVGLFTTDALVAAAGGQYLRGYIWDSFLGGIQFSFSGYFCALGRSGLSFLHNFLSILLVRVPGAYLTSAWFPDNLMPMGLASAAGSLFSSLVCVGAYIWLGRRKK